MGSLGSGLLIGGEHLADQTQRLAHREVTAAADHIDVRLHGGLGQVLDLHAHLSFPGRGFAQLAGLGVDDLAQGDDERC